MTEIREKVIHVGIRGTRPLMQNEFVISKDKSKRNVYDPIEEANKAMVKSPSGEPAVKSSQLEATIINAGKEFKFRGRKTYMNVLKSGVRVEPEFPLLKDAEMAIDVRPVVVQRARVPRARPRYDKWSTDFKLIISDDQIDPLVMREIVERAGQRVGLSELRPKFGLFEVVSWKED